MDLQSKLATPTLLDHIHWREYLIGLLLITLFALWQGAYSQYIANIENLTVERNTLAANNDREIRRSQDEIHTLKRQLAMPDLFPEILNCMVLEGPHVGAPMLAQFGNRPPKDTEVRIQLRVTNRNRVKATVSSCELVIEPNESWRALQPIAENYADPLSTPIEFGCPQTLALRYKLERTERIEIANKPFVIRITDGTGNVSMTTVQRL